MSAAVGTAVGCYSGSGGMLVQGGFSDTMTSLVCRQQCVAANKSVAAMQYKTCFCGDELPATSFKGGDCNTPCPGYPLEMCGGSAAFTVWTSGLSATVGTASGEETSNNGEDSSSNAASVAPSSSQPPPPPPSSSHPPTSTHTPPPATTKVKTQVSQKTVTVGGSPSVIIITASADPAATSISSPSPSADSTSGGSKAGIAAGVVVGLVALVAIIAAIILMLKRRQRRNDESHHRRNSSLNAFVGSKHPGVSVSTTDSRLDPRIMVQRRESAGSVFADNHDYSRRILKVANPDE